MFPSAPSLPPDAVTLIFDLAFEGIFRALKFRRVCKTWKDWTDKNVCQKGLDQTLSVDLGAAGEPTAPVWFSAPRAVRWDEWLMAHQWLKEGPVRSEEHPNDPVPRLPFQSLGEPLTVEEPIVPPPECVAIRFYRLYRIFDWFATNALMQIHTSWIHDPPGRKNPAFGVSTIMGILVHYSITSAPVALEHHLWSSVASALRIDFRIGEVRGAFLLRSSKSVAPIDNTDSQTRKEIEKATIFMPTGSAYFGIEDSFLFSRNYSMPPTFLAGDLQRRIAQLQGKWSDDVAAVASDQLAPVLCFFREENRRLYCVSSKGSSRKEPLPADMFEPEYDEAQCAHGNLTTRRLAPFSFGTKRPKK